MKQALLLTALLLAGCISTGNRANFYLNKAAADIEPFEGRPLKVVDLPDGRRAYDYCVGRGSSPGGTIGGQTVTIGGQSFTSGGTDLPPISIPGDVVTFIAERKRGKWIVVEARRPQGKDC